MDYKYLETALRSRFKKYYHRQLYKLKRYSLVLYFLASKINFLDRSSKNSLFPNCDVFYINLDSREDRNKEICRELKSFRISGAKRFPGIHRSSGALGCSLSHQSVITNSRTSEIRGTVVFEDDLIFIARPKLVGRVVREFLNNPAADVLCIANFTKDRTTYFSPNLQRTTDVQTMACYLFKPHMKMHLERASELSIKQLVETDGAEGILDKKWKMLQKDFTFVVPRAKLAIQRNSFSDILKKQAKYDF